MRFLFAWELGGGLGHTAPLGQIAEPLLKAGHRVDFVLKDLSTAEAALGGIASHPNAGIWQAPVWQPHYLAPRHPICYAELLFGVGYLDARRLLGLVHGWRSIFRALVPDFLLCDHAPTALLAARGSPFPRGIVGSGFFVPPHRAPMPAFAEWEPPDEARVVAAERVALDTCNAVLGALGSKPLDALCDLYRTDEDFLLTWPELDHYAGLADRPGSRYWGALSPARLGAVPIWPEGDGRRLFAYLKAEYAPAGALLQLLARGPWRTHAFISGIPSDRIVHFQSPFLHISQSPADLDAVATAADAFLSHGNFNTVSQLLRGGLPALLLPTQAEQLLVARRVAQAGAGLMMIEDQAVAELPIALRRFATEPGFGAVARAFAVRYGPGGDADCGDVALRVAQRCEALARGEA